MVQWFEIGGDIVKENYGLRSALVLIFVSILAACQVSRQVGEKISGSTGQVQIETPSPEPQPPTAEIPTPTAGEEEPAAETSRRVSFGQLGISLEVPAELFVMKDPLVNIDDPDRLDSYLFYIQNYGYPGGSNSGDFQIYGHYQYDLPPTTWEEFALNTINSPMNEYAQEIDINGLRGFDTQLSGQRNRFVYQFLVDGRVLSLAVSEPTDENKALADQIISSLSFDQDLYSNQSRVQKVVEPNFFYQLYLPDDWEINFGTPAGIRLSDLQASSADLEIVIEDTEGPHANISYKNGIALNLVILEDESALAEPTAAVIRNVDQVMYSGIEMVDYIFVEPGTMEGELRELRFSLNGNSYLLRFSYADGVDQDLINWIIRNLQILE
jgi:hypothetical protein